MLHNELLDNTAYTAGTVFNIVLAMQVANVYYQHIQPVICHCLPSCCHQCMQHQRRAVHIHHALTCHALQPAVMLPQEELWKSLFSEPSKWYDKRPTVSNRPNFVHKQHHFSLWLSSAPEWVAKGIADADSAVKVLWEKVGVLCRLHSCEKKLFWLQQCFSCKFLYVICM